MSASLVGSEMCIRDRRPTSAGCPAPVGLPRCSASAVARPPRGGTGGLAPSPIFAPHVANWPGQQPVASGGHLR
eukprot:3012567-Alexandrium_andersonii.AAC.1